MCNDDAEFVLTRSFVLSGFHRVSCDSESIRNRSLGRLLAMQTGDRAARDENTRRKQHRIVQVRKTLQLSNIDRRMCMMKEFMANHLLLRLIAGTGTV